MEQQLGLMQGKRGLVIGVANNRSIAKRPDAPDIPLAKE